MYSSGIQVDEGDSIFCNMTRTGPSSWVIEGTVQSTGEKTTQSATNDRLSLQPWAYNTVECYGCTGCDTYPSTPLTFTENRLYQNGKEVVVPGSAWEINPKPAKRLECQERTEVDGESGDTTVYFQG